MLSHLKTFSALYFLIALGIVVFCYNLKLNEKNVEIGMLQNKNTELTLSIKEQNVAIETWKSEAENAEKKQREKEHMAAKNMEQANKDAMNILNTNVPKDCQSAVNWGVAEALKMRSS